MIKRVSPARYRPLNRPFNPGDKVKLKSSVPPEFSKYAGLQGLWQSHHEEFSSIWFDGLGDIKIPSRFLIRV